MVPIQTEERETKLIDHKSTSAITVQCYLQISELDGLSSCK